MIEALKERAKCQDCLKNEYCRRIPVNEIIVQAIREKGKCPDFVSLYVPSSSF
jgi:hypothetical protein